MFSLVLNDTAQGHIQTKIHFALLLLLLLIIAIFYCPFINDHLQASR